MALTRLAPVPAPRDATIDTAPVLDVVIPVYNEQDDLEVCVRRLHTYLLENLPYTFRITVADNASTDSTLAVAKHLSHIFPAVHVLSLDQKGKGRALRAAWVASESPVLAYMDVDLSTDLAGLFPLIAPLISGHSDLAIGTRLHRGARVVRGAKREFISRRYNQLLRHTMSARFSDATCGFKAIRREVAAILLPHVQDETWFFDTELLVLAERTGLRIHEVPVDWTDDPNSSVPILNAAKEDLRGIVRLTRSFARGRVPLTELVGTLSSTGREPATPGVPLGLAGQVVRFAAVGVLSTVLFTVAFLGYRDLLGAQGANLAALLTATIANTALNRRFTFRIAGRTDLGRHHLRGLVVFALALAVTSGALQLAHHGADPSLPVEIVVLVAANVAATALRFVLFRNWVFRKV